MMDKFNKFHMVTMSPWPLLSSMQALNCMTLVVFINNMKINKMKNMTWAMMMIMTSMTWWTNTTKESNMEGMQQSKTKQGIKIGMMMFITSEIMFFLSFFWSYFHSGMSPSMELGQMWPPKEIKSFNPINVPLLNTIILVSSGFSITWAHHLMLENKMNKANKGISLTIMLGLYFSMLQYMEYSQSEFSMNDSSYGTIFFMATGFHGIHVMVGSMFIMINLLMAKKMYLTNKNHMGFEMSAWYWHFVDVVWLFLYLSVYWWGK